MRVAIQMMRHPNALPASALESRLTTMQLPLANALCEYKVQLWDAVHTDIKGIAAVTNAINKLNMVDKATIPDVLAVISALELRLAEMEHQETAHCYTEGDYDNLPAAATTELPVVAGELGLDFVLIQEQHCYNSGRRAWHLRKERRSYEVWTSELEVLRRSSKES
ncbi:unnamed protein product, partial [Iphiclides podalirius]